MKILIKNLRTWFLLRKRQGINFAAQLRNVGASFLPDILSDNIVPVFIFLVNILLIYPLFTGEYTQHMGSIESAFISTALFINRNGFANWNPLWYCGFPAHLSYPPLIPCLMVILHRLIPIISIPGSYRLLTALAYALGPVTLYAFGKYLTRRKFTAFALAIIYSLALMPIYNTIPFGVKLAPNLTYVPYQMMVLTLFGEGPHILGLTMIPLVALFLLRSLQRPSFKHYVSTSLGIATIALTNLIALYALALISIIILLSATVKKGQIMRTMKTALICGIVAYGLVAFAYDLSFIESSISFGLLFELEGQILTWQNFTEMIAITIVVLSILYLYFMKRRNSQPLFIASAWTAVFLIITLNWYFFNVPLAPQPNRYIPELNIGIALLLAISLTFILDTLGKTVSRKMKRMWKLPSFVLISVVILLFPFVQSTWEITSPNQDIENTPEYIIGKWLSVHGEEQRVFATGTIGFWLNVFTSIPQLRGGSDQGSTNPYWRLGAEQLHFGSDGKLGVLWCKAFNIRYIIVIYANADTPYHCYHFPNKFEEILPLRYTFEGFGIYEVPLKHPGFVQLVEVTSVQDVRLLQGIGDDEDLSKYVDCIETTTTARCHYTFNETDRLTVTVMNATESTSILVKMTIDERWRAYADDREIMISEVGPGFMLISPNTKGNYKLRLICDTTVSEDVGTAITLVTVILMLAFVVYTRKNPKPMNDNLSLH